MIIKGVSATKGISDIFHAILPAMPARSNPNTAVAVNLLQQQKRRFIKEREKLELKLIANEQGLSALSEKLERVLLTAANELDLLTKSNSSSSTHSKGKSELKEGKQLNKIRLDY